MNSEYLPLNNKKRQPLNISEMTKMLQYVLKIFSLALKIVVNYSTVSYLSTFKCTVHIHIAGLLSPLPPPTELLQP